jgi:anti-anti-sigma factor
VRWAGHSAIISLPAEIDINNAGQVSDELLRVLDQGAATLVVDMTGTTFCASAGVHAVLRAHKSATAIPVKLRLVAGGRAVWRVLELTGADRVIDTYPSLDTALAGMPMRWDGTGGAASGYGAAASKKAGTGEGATCPCGPAG